MKTEIIQALTTNFEAHARQTDGGVEYWLGRDIQHLLGYAQWRNFLNTVSKARTACEVSGQSMSDHFADVSKMVDIGSGTTREVEDLMDLLLQLSLREISTQVLDQPRKDFDWAQYFTSAALGAGFGFLFSPVVTQSVLGVVQSVIRQLGNLLNINTGKVLFAGAAVGYATDAEATVKVLPSKAAKGVNSVRAETQIALGNARLVRGATEFVTTPQAQTKSFLEATEWYLTEAQKIGNWVKDLPVTEQLKQAIVLNRLLLQGAEATMYNKNMARELKAKFGVNSRKLLNELSGKFTGEKLQQEMLKRITGRDFSAALKSYQDACFVGGTLVHTKEGLKPIEEIKVGDWVLSKHESGEGEREYKRVTKTFMHEGREVIRLYVGEFEGQHSFREYSIFVTPEHPFWVKGKKWKPVGNIRSTYKNRAQLEALAHDNTCYLMISRLFSTSKPGVAWEPGGPQLIMKGRLVDVATGATVEEGVFSEHWPGKARATVKPEHIFRSTVYNIEVEDFHTYYVGETGVWVHNKSITLLKPDLPDWTPKVDPAVKTKLHAGLS